MRSTFFGVELARRALQAQQRALDVTGQNIANANTPGYSRQIAMMRTTNAYVVKGQRGTYSVGTGVEVGSITRMRDSFLDGQFRNEQSALGYWESLETTFAQIEASFNEPSDAGLQKVFNQFWAAWQDVANNPGSLSARAGLIEQTETLTTSLNGLNRRLGDLGDSLFKSAATRVDDINLLADQIAALNVQITNSSAAGNIPNDLLDKRDLLIDQLARLVPVRVYERDSVVRISLDGSALVDGRHSSHLQIERGASGEAVVTWKDRGITPDLGTGELAAIIHMQAEELPAYRQDLSNIADALATAINDLHRNGFSLDGATDGLDFFVVTTDEDGYTRLTINPALVDDPTLIAASAHTHGDGDNALAIANELERTQTSLNATISEYYRALISGIGIQSAGAQQQASNQRLLVQQIDMQRQSVAGVSLDEEMTMMIQYQQAYNAAARFVQVTDELLDTLINRL